MKSNVPGVIYDSSRDRWRAYMPIDGNKRHFLGSKKTKEEAEKLRLDADIGVLPSDEEKRTVVLDRMARLRMRAVWREVTKSHHNWSSFDDFLATVGDRPKTERKLVPIDDSKMIGPDNFKWVAPKYDHLTQEGRKAYLRDRYSNDPNLYRRGELQRKFGITIEQYNEMHNAQNGVCAICSQPETALRKGKLLPLSVDHNHGTGQVRSLLCTSCNIGIGSFQEDYKLLERAIEYILKWENIEHSIPKSHQSKPIE